MALVGCGDDSETTGSGGSSSTGQGGGGGGGGGEVDYCGAPAGQGITDISGRWAYMEVLAEKILASGAEYHSKQTTIATVDVTQDGENVSLSGAGDGHLCKMVIEDPDAKVHKIIIDKYWQAFPAISRDATFTSSEGSFRSPMYTTVVGADLTNPETDDLPTDTSDTRVTDADDDTFGGLSYNVNGAVDGTVYTVVRTKTQLDGVALSADSIQGSVTFTMEHPIIGSVPDTLKNILSAQFFTDVTPCASHFRMVRIGDADDCADVLARLDELFP